jgi:hypothetical protein
MKILVLNNGNLRAGISGGDKHLLDVGEALAAGRVLLSSLRLEHIEGFST